MEDIKVESPLKTAAEILGETRDTVTTLLEGYPMLSLEMKSKINLLINKLNFIGGTRTSLAGTSDFKKQPITEFMGETLNTPKAVTTDDLTPQELERKLFTEKVNRLKDAFSTLENSVILESYKTEPTVIRGVAKLSGLKDFREAELNDAYITKIRESFEAQALANEKKQQTESEINGK